jgi:hypothetical protein
MKIESYEHDEQTNGRVPVPSSVVNVADVCATRYDNNNSFDIGMQLNNMFVCRQLNKIRIHSPKYDVFETDSSSSASTITDAVR